MKRQIFIEQETQREQSEPEIDAEDGPLTLHPDVRNPSPNFH